MLMSILIVMLVCTPALAQETKAKPLDKATVKAKCQIIDKELRELEARMYAARKKIEKSEAIIDLRKEATDAENAYQKGKTDDPAVVAAKAESRAADREYDALLLKKVRSSPAGMALLKEKVALDNKRAACSLQSAIAEIKLTHEDSPIVRALEADPIIAQYKRAYAAAEGDARVEAKADYQKLMKATLDDMPAARALRAEIKTAKADEDAAEKALDAVDDKLDELRDKVKKSKAPELLAARARYTAAQAAYQKAYYGGKMQALRDNREKTRAAIYAGVKEAIDGDPILAALSRRIHQLESQYKTLAGRSRKRRSSRRH
jgi:5'-3' exonuclease